MSAAISAETLSSIIKEEQQFVSKPKMGTRMLASVVLDVVRQEPGDDRANHPMFDATMTWLRRSNDMFSHLPEDVLSEMVKRCQHLSVPANTVIIKQGDAADSFYAILSGNASAWVLPIMGNDDNIGSKLDAINRGQQLSVVDKHKLGMCVKKYAPGGTFGELALLMPDGVRNASVVADEPCELATIDRNLYNRLLLAYQRKEYEERLEICNACPLFVPISKSHRVKLAMAMEKVHLEFDNFLSIQGQPATNLYFVLKGNAKVIVDPEMHIHQNNILESVKSLLTVANQNQIEARKQGRWNRSMGAIMMLTSAGGGLTHSFTGSKIEQQQLVARAKTAIDLAAQRRGHVIKPGVQEVCWINDGEIVGDAEAVLGLDTYLWSVIAAEPTEVYALSMQNFRRIYNAYRSNESASLAIEQACFGHLSERLQRIDTPLCRRLLKHLKTNLDEAAAFAYEMSKPKMPMAPAQRDWSQTLEAFRKRRLLGAEKRSKVWVPPKPCTDAKTINALYDAWQDEEKQAALMRDSNSVAMKALTKQECKAKILHQCATKVNKQRAVASSRFRKFTEALADEALKDEEEADKTNHDRYHQSSFSQERSETVFF